MAGVSLNQAVKKYGDATVIHGVNLHIESGEFCVFVGPSGCGKSTLLRMIAGLEETTQGQIAIGARDVTHMDAAERGIAMVFQSYALYPHMTVKENMGFGLKMNGVDKAVIAQKVDEVAKILQLQDYMARKPAALSGGQRQRVAIGRALVRGPDVFLFDEPLSNLDAELRVDMRVEIARLHQELGTTMIYVTHDQVEAMTLADKIVVLRKGRVEQIGTPMQLYSDPNNKFVAGFIGSPSMNFVSLSALAGHDVSLPNITDERVIIGIRPEHLELDPLGVSLTVRMVELLGGVSYIHAHTDNGEKLIIEHKSTQVPKANDKIGIRFSSDHLYFFDKNSEQRICL